MFWSVIGSGFGEPVAYPLPPLHHQEPSGVPRGIFVVSSLTFFLSAEAPATRESRYYFLDKIEVISALPQPNRIQSEMQGVIYTRLGTA